ncbi:MAG: cell division protein FtsZ [Patescibacteria group bacterium]|nr:cell division protein FtsZ [Patescibacteria group bacterium]
MKTKKKEVKKEVESDTTKKIKIRIIGVGGGGGNIISELSKKLKDFSTQKVDFVAVNTDNQALKSLPKTVKTFSFGNNTTRGLGTGRNFEVGEKAAKEDIEKMKQLFKEDRDLYIFVSSLGGGTGTGATPVLVKIAEEMGLNSIGIFTLPFSFEGKKKMDAALKSLEKIKESLNAHMILPNEKIFSIAKEEISFADSLNLLNSRLSESLEGLLRTIYMPGLINIDWADIRTIIEGKKKTAYLNFTKAKSTSNVEEVTAELLKSPVLEYPFENAENVMFNVESDKNLSLQMLSLISEKISELSPNARIIFGLMQNPKFKNDIRITILATAEEAKEEGKKKSKKQKPKKKPVEEKEVEIRKSALEIKEEESKEKEKEDEEESVYEIPAFLRKKKK